MERIGWMVAALMLIIVTTGCFEHTYTMGQDAAAAPIVYDEWQVQWLGGLIGERTLDIDVLCPSGNATIHDEQSFLNGLVSALTVGIFTPTTVKIRCEGGRSAEVDLAEEDVIGIVAAPAFMERIEAVMPERLEEARLGRQALAEDLKDRVLAW
ncbi:MAG: hypothetical protein BMS9Abin29_2336 [Gemmatimonadota bacterium]|nr:MAG: hypothetical protein BMS9Abin29_2336 [Gemmatimonadota bacterium]